MSRRVRSRTTSIALSAIVLTGGALAFAACDPLPPCTRTWTGGAGTSTFSDPGNWSGDAVPGAGERACAAPGSSIVVDVPTTLGSYLLDGSVTIPPGSSLTNTTAADVLSLIDTLDLQGTLDGNAGVLARGATVTGTIQGTSFVALLGTHPVSVDGMTIDGSKAVLTSTNPTLGSHIRLCGNGALGFTGVTTISSPLTVDSVGCASVGTPAFGVYETGTLAINANINASTVAYGSMGTVNVGAGAVVTSKSNTHYKGTTTLGTGSAMNPADGTYTLTAGTLTGTGTIGGDVAAANAVIEPGTNHAGTLNVQGHVSMGTGSGLTFDVAGTTAGTDFGQLSATTINLTNGALTATAAPGFAAATGDTMDLVLAAGITGAFSSTTTPALAGHGVTTTVGLSTVSLRVTDCDPSAFYPGANFQYGDISGLDLTGCNLSGAYLWSTNMAGTNFTRADLSGATIATSDMTGATITGANMNGAMGATATTGLLSTLAHGWTDTDLGGTLWNLTGQDLSAVGTELHGVNLSGSYLSGVNLAGADLSAADLVGTDLSGATITDANIEGIDFMNAYLTNTDLNGSTGLPSVSLPASYSTTTCPTGVNSNANGFNCEGQWNPGGGGGAVGTARR